MVKKMLIIGWDGAPFKLINNLIKENNLPNLNKIIKNGFFGQLETVPYVMSSCAWSTMVTGKNAGKHGIFDFYSNEFNGDSYFRNPISAINREEKEVWKYLSKRDIKIGLINIPMTYPAKKVNGYMVAGMLTPKVNSKYFTYPDDLLNNYKGLQNYIIDIVKTQNMTYDDLLNDVYKMIESRTDLILYLIKNHKNVDLLFAVYTAPDRISHFFWHFYDKSHPYIKNESSKDIQKFKNVIADIYKKLDEELGIIIKTFKKYISNDFSIMVLSDHGMSSLKKIVHINKILNKKGYLKFKPKKDWIEFKKDILDSKVGYIYGKIDWLETKAYSIGKRGAIYINLKGREPYGIIEKNDYEKIIKQIKEDFTNLKDPSIGNKIVKNIKSRDELFFGKNIEKAPDILIYLYNGYFPFGYAIDIDKPNIISINDDKYLYFVTGIESGDGILCIYDKRVKSNSTYDESKIIDITPTLMYMFNSLIPIDMDGRVLTEIFKNCYLIKHPIKYTDIN